jgi:phage terminase Nu1 subunit (DNA packaging protein)
MKASPEPRNGRIGIMTRQELAILTGWDNRRFSEWAARDCLVRVGRNQYDGDRTIRRILDWNDHARQVSQWGGDPNDPSVNPARERHAAMAAQRRINEIRLARLEGQMFDMADIKAMWGAIMVAVRQMVLAIPSRCAAELPHLTRHDLAVMERECGEILRMNSLANPEVGPLPEPK